MLNFFKLQSFGNDFIACDMQEFLKFSHINFFQAKKNDFCNFTFTQILNIEKNFIQKICNRHLGIGADQLIIFEKITQLNTQNESQNESIIKLFKNSNNALFANNELLLKNEVLKINTSINEKNDSIDTFFIMHFFNPDGSQAEVCINAIRAFALLNKHLFDECATKILPIKLIESEAFYRTKLIENQIKNTQIFKNQKHLKNQEISNHKNKISDYENTINFYEIKMRLPNLQIFRNKLLFQNTEQGKLFQNNNFTKNDLCNFFNLPDSLRKHLVFGRFINVGNPHFVLFFENNVFKSENDGNKNCNNHGENNCDNSDNFYDNCSKIYTNFSKKFDKIANDIEKNPIFINGINVAFASLFNKNLIKLRVFERGASWTHACGSGACASVAAYVDYCNDSSNQTFTVQQLGGNTKIIAKKDTTAKILKNIQKPHLLETNHIIKNYGNATICFSGEYQIS